MNERGPQFDPTIPIKWTEVEYSLNELIEDPRLDQNFRDELLVWAETSPSVRVKIRVPNQVNIAPEYVFVFPKDLESA